MSARIDWKIEGRRKSLILVNERMAKKLRQVALASGKSRLWNIPSSSSSIPSVLQWMSIKMWQLEINKKNVSFTTFHFAVYVNRQAAKRLSPYLELAYQIISLNRIPLVNCTPGKKFYTICEGNPIYFVGYLQFSTSILKPGSSGKLKPSQVVQYLWKPYF